MTKHEIGDIVRITGNYDNVWKNQSLVIYQCLKPKNDDVGVIYMELYRLKTIDGEDVPFLVYGCEIESVTLWSTYPK